MTNILFSEGTTENWDLVYIAVELSCSSTRYDVAVQTSLNKKSPFLADKDLSHVEFFEKYHSVEWVRDKFDIVVCHAGAGTVFSFLEMGVPLIVMPDLTRKDKHQLEICEFLEREGFARIARTNNNCLQLIREGNYQSKKRYINVNPFDVTMVKDWLNG